MSLPTFPPYYELIVLGTVETDDIAKLEARLSAIADEFGLVLGKEIALRTVADCDRRNPFASTAALYFGGDKSCDQALIDTLEAAKIPIVPVVQRGIKPEDVLPDTISALNACFLDPADTERDALIAVALECLGLLHTQRRVFVSYRRTEARAVAVQLHDELSGRGFDVFLDTHDIRPGLPFQEMLWHRLVDCDVVIMLDTPDYYESKWTSQELGRSLSKGIHVLQMVWPLHQPTRQLELSDTIRLTKGDFTDVGQLVPATIDTITSRTERLRSRSFATRQMSLLGKLIPEIERIGGKVEGIGAFRAVAADLPNGFKIQAYPVVGIPTAELLHDIQEKANTAGHGRFPCLVFDHLGIRPGWLAHLAWLDRKIDDVRALKIMDAGWELVEWDN
jgi:hypothetical protein